MDTIAGRTADLRTGGLRHPLRISFLVLMCFLAAPFCTAQGGFEVLKGKALSRATPRDFYLEGNAIAVERRNAALVRTPSGARVLAALIVTTGWASQAPHKYLGLLITEGPLSVCNNRLGVGSYGFGLHRPAASNGKAAGFFLYNQAGQEVGKCQAPRDPHLKEPKPLQVVVNKPQSARLYLGRYGVELQP